MGWLESLFAPEREKKIATLREIARDETYKGLFGFECGTKR